MTAANVNRGVNCYFHDFYDSSCLHFHSKNQVIRCLPFFTRCITIYWIFLFVQENVANVQIEGLQIPGYFIRKVWDFRTFFAKNGGLFGLKLNDVGKQVVCIFGLISQPRLIQLSITCTFCQND